jgi:HSP20 family protein
MIEPLTDAFLVDCIVQPTSIVYEPVQIIVDIRTVLVVID